MSCVGSIKPKGLLIVLSGPSGAGKGVVKEIVSRHLPNSRHSVSVTTRAPRAGEVEGEHYYFKTVEQYQQMIASGEFLETAAVHLNYYGTPKQPVFDMLKSGHDVIFEVDTLGAEQIRVAYPESILIFIMAPSFEELKNRLLKRASETPVSLERRLDAAKLELSRYKKFDYLVINDDADVCANQILGIIEAERLRTSREAELAESMLNA